MKTGDESTVKSFKHRRRRKKNNIRKTNRGEETSGSSVYVHTTAFSRGEVFRAVGQTWLMRRRRKKRGRTQEQGEESEHEEQERTERGDGRDGGEVWGQFDACLLSGDDSVAPKAPLQLQVLQLPPQLLPLLLLFLLTETKQSWILIKQTNKQRNLCH